MTTDDTNTKPVRDDFTPSTKAKLALRANYRCSYTGCGIATSGPSDEGAERSISIGEAAHITAAAPGGERYDPEMTPAQRKHISNGIWMCKIHARLVDVDASAYPVTKLHNMKIEHEARIKLEMTGLRPGPKVFDFIAIGPSVVFVGELVAIEQKIWSFRVEHFVIGDLTELITYIEQFDAIDSYDKFVLVNELGDGRELSNAPSWAKSGDNCLISVPITASVPKIDVNRLPMDLALGDDHDLLFVNGGIARVSGLDALPQKIKTCLSMSQGESWFAPSFGTRIREYTVDFFGSPWLPRLIKLEVIRMAAIPYSDSLGISPPVPPLRCVRIVKAIDQIDSKGQDGWFKFRFQLDIEGLGEWTSEIPIFISRDL
ncbi:hypothetical protein [Pseudomonas umsongensis]|uniref:hypothetical protein n=1 Tax=Pseudomonas umsongensis TaxID=198618 RepID=UPI0003A18722|nr:hypothetical protein [Pseudomonas umsongensis]